jgi:hypothetical protein
LIGASLLSLKKGRVMSASSLKNKRPFSRNYSAVTPSL